MKSFLGTIQLSRGEPPVAISLLIFENEIQYGYRDSHGQNTTQQWALQDIHASYSAADQATIIKNVKLPSYNIEVPGKVAMEHIHLLQEEIRKPWHQKARTRSRARSVGISLGIIAFFVGLYFLVVPWLSMKLASRVSINTEQQFGDAMYDGLSLGAGTDSAASYEVNRFFANMEISTPYSIRITVVKGEVVNAFAIPGGRIVIYDALLRKMESYTELAALLSHEFTHIQNRHTTKSIFRKLGSKIFISMLLGNFGSVTAVLIDHADDLSSLKYSRKLEKEADLDGLNILLERKIDPRGFADLFRHLKEAAPGSVIPELLESHPDIEKRIEYIKATSSGAVVEENLELKTIFDNLKQKILQ